MRSWFFSLVSAALLALAAVQPLTAQQAPPGEAPKAGFFSSLPPLPRLQMPDLRIPFWTDDLKTGRKAYDKGNYDKALKYFRRASDEGNLVADWYLGHMYRTGRGVAQDDAMAFSYYARVAEIYDPDDQDKTRLRITIDARIRLADYYRTGVPAAGIAPDYARAYGTYMQFSTAYGHPAASYGLGVLYINGLGVNRNTRQGLKWMAASARKRYPPAEAFLGDAYWTGRIVPQDQTRGLMWYILANESTSANEFPELLDRLELMKAAVKQDQLLEAEARAKVWNTQFPVQDNSD